MELPVNEKTHLMNAILEENPTEVFHRLRTLREIVNSAIKEQIGIEMLCARVGCGIFGASKTVYFCNDKEPGRTTYLQFESNIRDTIPTISMRLTFELKDFLTSNQFLKNKLQQDGTI